MEKPLYIRLRGRVLGPFDTAKLQSLAKRGQLSRLHEVSSDSIHWEPAAEHPELFVSEELPRAAVASQSPKAHSTPAMFPEQPAVSGRRWWYRKNGSQVGPVEEAALVETLASGMLGGEDFVWTDGMPQWVPARQVPELNTAPAAAMKSFFSAAQPDVNEKVRDLPMSLCKAAAHSRPWVLLVAIGSFVYAGLSILGGIVLLILGANNHLPPVVAQGIFGMIFGIDASIGGCLLMSYANRLGGLKFGSKEIVLEKCLDALKAFWIFLGINLILFLGLLAFFAVWFLAFASASSFPLSPEL